MTSFAPPIKIMALLPASKDPSKLTGSSLLDEEIPAISERGVEVNTVVYSHIGKVSQHLKRHLHPRVRHLPSTAQAVFDCLRYGSLDAIAAPRAIERFQLAQAQRSIARIINSHRLDLVHSHWARPAGTAGAMAKLLTGVPLVITLRGSDVFTEASIGYGNTADPWYVRRLRHAFNCANRIIGVSSQIIARAIELGADPTRTIVIPKGVHHQNFVPGNRTEARQKLGIEDRPTILFVGALGPWKGIQDLLEAFAWLRSQIAGVQLVFVGKGELQTEIERFRTERQLEQDIRLCGYISREALPMYFQACDVFTLPSLTEGSGNVLLEAAACGKPSVGTRVGGIPDYIVDGQTGLLCNKRDPADLAAKLLTMLKNPTMAQQMGERGWRRVLSGYRYDQMIDRTIEVYQQVLADPKRCGKAVRTT